MLGLPRNSLGVSDDAGMGHINVGLGGIVKLNIVRSSDSRKSQVHLRKSHAEAMLASVSS